METTEQIEADRNRFKDTLQTLERLAADHPDMPLSEAVRLLEDPTALFAMGYQV